MILYYILFSSIVFLTLRYPADYSTRRALHQHHSVGTPGGDWVNGVCTPPATTPGGLGIMSPLQSQIPGMGPAPTPLDCLKVIVHYLKREEKDKILRLLFDGSPPLVKFKKFNFRCRTLISEKENMNLFFNGPLDRLQNTVTSVFSDDEFQSTTLWSYYFIIFSSALLKLTEMCDLEKLLHVL